MQSGRNCLPRSDLTDVAVVCRVFRDGLAVTLRHLGLNGVPTVCGDQDLSNMPPLAQKFTGRFGLQLKQCLCLFWLNNSLWSVLVTQPFLKNRFWFNLRLNFYFTCLFWLKMYRPLPALNQSSRPLLALICLFLAQFNS